MWTIFIAILASAVFLSACGSDDSNGTAGSSDQGLKVRVITSTPTATGSWDKPHYDQYSAAAKELGWNLEVAEAVPYGEADQVLSRWGDEKVDIVFSTDNGFEDNFLAAAEKYPDTDWAMMTALSTTKDLPNVAAYLFDWCEFGFLHGVAGGLASKGTVGLDASIHIIPTTQWVLGAEHGIKTANPDAKVITDYTEDVLDPRKAQELASALIERGADVILPVVQSGNSAQIAARAQADGALYVGAYIDESEYAPKATVTSVLFNLENAYRTVGEQREAGNFKAGIFVQGAEDGVFDFAPFGEGFTDLENPARELLEKLKSGEITIPKKCEDAATG
ncbi:MAG: BMP family ABC transporter substrate-binding protein [Gaiellaceae bacterium]